MLAQPSYGCFFLLAVIFYSGSTAQKYDDPGNEAYGPANETHGPGNDTDVYDDDGNKAQEYGNPGNETPVYYYGEYYDYNDDGGKVIEKGPPLPLPVCHAEVCVRKCCPLGEVRPRL